jgi:uncharacterized membrane protein
MVERSSNEPPRGLLGRLPRLLRHRWLDETDTRRALGPEALSRIEQRIAQSEARHGGEIRVCVEAGLPLSYLWRDASARERAVSMFGKLRVWDTEVNSGVLIYLLLAEHAIEIVADRYCVETKSLKQYFWSYRNEGAFHEKVTNAILSDMVKAISPRFARVHADWYVRGGIRTYVTVEHRQKGWKPGPMVTLPGASGTGAVT